jgi:hypothetical protein
VGDTSTSALDEDLFAARGGGPRASIPANAGLKRPASLPDFTGSLGVNTGAVCTGLMSMDDLLALRLFFLAKASGVVSLSF